MSSGTVDIDEFENTDADYDGEPLGGRVTFFRGRSQRSTVLQRWSTI